MKHGKKEIPLVTQIFTVSFDAFGGWWINRDTVERLVQRTLHSQLGDAAGEGMLYLPR